MKIIVFLLSAFLLISCSEKATINANSPEELSQSIAKMKEDLDNVKGELGEIKGLLSTLVQKLNN